MLLVTSGVEVGVPTAAPCVFEVCSTSAVLFDYSSQKIPLHSSRGFGIIHSCTRAWRNWQTRTVQVRMRAIS